ALTALRVGQVQLAYRLDAARSERARAERLLRQLDVEVATLRAPVRLEARARQLGLGSPSREQVRLAREFVPGVSGAAAARDGGGTVAAARVARSEAVVR